MKEIETLSLMHIASGESYFKIPLLLIHRERSGDSFDFTYRLISQKGSNRDPHIFLVLLIFSQAWPSVSEITKRDTDCNGSTHFQPIFTYIPPENIKEPQFSNVFRVKEMEHWLKLDKVPLKNNFEMDSSLLFLSAIQIAEFYFHHNLN